jgi:hypothetical protein
MLATGGGLMVLLTIACFLSPAPQGYGTHRQLGLPDCSMMSVYGVRCPACGMTTSWSHVMRGNVIGAVQANTGGAILCALSLVCGPVLIGLSVAGRPSRGGWLSMVAIAGLCLALGIAFVEWMIRLAVEH